MFFYINALSQFSILVVHYLYTIPREWFQILNFLAFFVGPGNRGKEKVKARNDGKQYW